MKKKSKPPVFTKWRRQPFFVRVADPFFGKKGQSDKHPLKNGLAGVADHFCVELCLPTPGLFGTLLFVERYVHCYLGIHGIKWDWLEKPVAMAYKRGYVVLQEGNNNQ